MQSSMDITSRLSQAITTCTTTQQKIVAQGRDATAKAAAAKKAYEEAEANVEVVHKACYADLKTVKERQSLLGRLLGEDDDAAIEDALGPIELSTGPLVLVPPAVPAPAKSATPALKKPEKKPSPAVVAAAGFNLSKPNYVNDPGYLTSCPVIVPHGSAFAELRCCECNTNIDPSRRTFMKGAVGVQKHLARTHGQKMDVAQALEKSFHRALSVEEVRRIEAGEVEVDRVVKGSLVAAAARGRKTVSASPVASPAVRTSGPSKRKADSVLSIVGEIESEMEERGVPTGKKRVTEDQARARVRAALGSLRYYME